MSLEDDARRFDPAAYAVAQQRVKSAPLDLTAADFEQLGIVSTRLETEAFEALRHAQLAVVQANKSSVRTLADADLTWDQFVAKHATMPMTLKNVEAVVAPLRTMWDDMNEKNKERNTKIAALEARVLELEASAAARTVQDHVGR
jgi:hypothetical protein